MRRRSRWRTAPATRLVAVELNDAVSRRANPAWSDLRVVDDAGREVPYVLHARTGGTTIEWRPARLLEPGFVSGRYTEATVDLGPAAGIHNLLRLQVDGQDDLQARVEVATSADGAEWKVIREGAPISRLAGVGPERLDVTYPDSRSSFVRLRILDTARRVPTCWRARGARDRHRAGAASGDRRAGRGCASRSRQRLDDVRPSPCCRFQKCGSRRRSRSFVRRVIVETSADGRAWLPAGARRDLARARRRLRANDRLALDLREQAGQAAGG